MNPCIVEKFTSGKFWLTIICGFVFAYAACKQIIKPEVTASILVMVFINYFQKKQENGKELPK